MTKTPAARAFPGDTDQMLVERTVAGDQKAYELLVIKYQRRIERLIGRMVRDTDLVEDIAQETFIRAYRALAQFRGEAQFYTWLYRIAVNTAKKALVDLKRDPVVSESALRGGDDDEETSGVENELTTAETPETVLAAKEIAHRELCHGGLARGAAPGGHAARDRGPELRRDRGSDELPDRHRAVPDLPGARGHFGEGEADAGKPVGQALVKARMEVMEMMDKRELISALADGQLRGDGFARASRRLRRRARRATWHAYHVVGEVLRSGELASAGTPPDAFLAKLQARLHRRTARAWPGAGGRCPHRTRRTSCRQRLALEAGGRRGVGGRRGRRRLERLGHGPRRRRSQPQLAARRLAPAARATVHAEPARRRMIRDPRLDQLLAAHRQLGGATALQAPSGFLRNATFEGPAR
jgi:RNA polymerase sigma factor (sigma-70 family)